MPNEDVVRTIAEVRSAVLGPVDTGSGTMVAAQVGRAIAHEAVAQATALAIQDAADYMRNVAMLAQAGMSVAATKIVSDPAKAGDWASAIQQLQAIADHGVKFFTEVGKAATEVVEEYPSG